MARWQEYQEEAAALFRSLGLEATTDESVEGVRAVHAVDVVVRSRRAGLDQLWLVECKFWSRRVGKVHVAALAEIVRDVGADRGVLLSEVGFQAGAVRMAQKSNLTLTSLGELREDVADELLTLRLREFRLRLERLRERLSAVGTRHRRANAVLHSYRDPPGRWGGIRLYAFVGVAEEGLRKAELGSWPAGYGCNFSTDEILWADSLPVFVERMEVALDQFEDELSAFEACNA